MAKTKKTKKKTSEAVQQFARKLNAWGQTLPPKQQTLLRWLISRCESREIKIGRGIYEVEIDIDKMNIEDAVIDALEGLNPRPDLPTSGWVNGPWWSRWSSRQP